MGIINYYPKKVLERTTWTLLKSCTLSSKKSSAKLAPVVVSPRLRSTSPAPFKEPLSETLRDPLEKETSSLCSSLSVKPEDSAERHKNQIHLTTWTGSRTLALQPDRVC